MLDLEERNRARKKAIRLLEHMDRTEKGLTDKLRQAERKNHEIRSAHSQDGQADQGGENGAGQAAGRDSQP